MDERKRKVLRAVVALYGLDGEPVGSGLLAEHFGRAVSSATLRNEMAALTKLGLLEQPHTSAGRVPSAKGYRYYIDNLMDAPAQLSAQDKKQTQAMFREMDFDPERLAQSAARALSDWTGYAVVATTPKSDDIYIAHFEVMQVGRSTAAVLAVTRLVDWYGTALRYDYPPVERYLGDTVNQVEQLKFVLANLPRTFMVFVGSLYERGLFLGELGTFGAMDLSIPVVQLFSVLALCLGAALAVHEKSSLTPKSAVGLLGLAVFYVFGVMAAQYITYTPVGLPHVAGVQARYLLPAFLMLFVLAAALLSHVLAPARAGGRRAEGLALSACGAVAAISAVLLFQHYFVGPVCLVP